MWQLRQHRTLSRWCGFRQGKTADRFCWHVRTPSLVSVLAPRRPRGSGCSVHTLRLGALESFAAQRHPGMALAPCAQRLSVAVHGEVVQVAIRVESPVPVTRRIRLICSSLDWCCSLRSPGP